MEIEEKNLWSFVPQKEIGTEGGDLGIEAKVSENEDCAEAV